jgi:malate synthase
VALPAVIDGVPVRVMDDLATAERSRWEVWHEIHHARFSIDDFLKIADEEYEAIQKDEKNCEMVSRC